MKSKIVIYFVVFIQAILCFSEAYSAINCHSQGLSGSECWSWFFAFIINIPVSFVIEDAILSIINRFSIETFGLQNSIRFSLYFVSGTLWWVTLVLVIKFVVAKFKRKTPEFGCEKSVRSAIDTGQK